MNEPLDPPDDYTPDKPDDSEEVARLKEEIAALRAIIKEAAQVITLTMQTPITVGCACAVLGKIDRELNQ